MVLFGDAGVSNTGQLTTNTAMTHLIYFLQVFNAFTSAAGSIAMRTMKKFHESVVTWYANLSIMLSSLLVMAI
jgi:hypothetical protein